MFLRQNTNETTHIDNKKLGSRLNMHVVNQGNLVQ